MVKGTKIGQLDRYVAIVEFTKGKDAFNANTRAETPLKEVWAKLMFKGSSEDIEEKVYSINKRDYVIYYDPDIVVKQIQDLAVIDGDIKYYVKGVNLDYGGRQKYVLLNCESNA